MTKPKRRSAVLALLLALLSLTTGLRAQSSKAAQNAVQSVNSNTVTPVNAPAFVDASVYGTDICAAINSVWSTWTSSNSNGVVIDARGVSNLNCVGSTNPWASAPVTNFMNTVLLPAGKITISGTWTLVNETRLIGEGPSTIIKAASNFPLNQDMIDMGGSAACPGTMNLDCLGVVIEHLTLDGGSRSGVTGIKNIYAQELSYVNDVTFAHMAGTGLYLGVTCTSGGPNGCPNSSSNSGPYTNISYTGTGSCLTILEKGLANGPNTLRGFNGFTCNTSNDPAISLDGSGTILRDITISGSSSSQDGIRIGSNTSGAAFADALVDIRASGPLGNLIHISSNQSTFGPDVSDLSILGVSQTVPHSINVTIYDELTGTSLRDGTVAMYAVGEPISFSTSGGQGSGYSRFTSSPSLPSWTTGTAAPGSSCSTGSLFSCTSGCTMTLYACTGTSSWVGIK